MTAERESAATGGRAPANFDRLAGLYQWMEWGTFGPWLERCRFAFLDEMKAARRALVLGDGDGRFTAALLQANADVEVDAVDASAAMLRALKRRAGTDAARVRTCAADLRRWEPTGAIGAGGFDMGAAQARGYDIVATHFVLDCLTTDEVRALAERVRPALKADGVWVVSEFAVPAGAYGRLVARPLIALLYFAFGALTGLRVRRLPEHGAALKQAGFALLLRRTWLGGLLTAEKWAFVVSDQRSEARRRAQPSR